MYSTERLNVNACMDDWLDHVAIWLNAAVKSIEKYIML
jgi:hypothetical protein